MAERTAREDLARQLRPTRSSLQEESTKQDALNTQVTEFRDELEQLRGAERGRSKGK
ncbi:hypothetical protein ACIHFD_34870 [Nonomuraea sp. NPDC051941]|uniref:hypothetical protein n=1 Tax=Nonomuraea sp. NPDC051941 TaxID=3364373 RepID=UPI0037CAADCA